MRRFLLASFAVLAAAVALWLALRDGDSTKPRATSAKPRTSSPQFVEALAKSSRAVMRALPGFEPGQAVRVTGKVIDRDAKTAVPSVEVVFRSPLGDASTNAAADGTYAIELPAGSYHVFVRDDAVLTMGASDRVRLPGAPRAETVGVPDEALMPLVVATRDLDHVEVAVVRSGAISGRVVDKQNRPIAHAMIRATNGSTRPALGTDLAETDANGNFELRLPSSRYQLSVSHARFASTTSDIIDVSAGSTTETTLTMSAGCIITGRVKRSDGTIASEGAIEKQWGESDLEFGPAGRIEPDGTFRWTSEEAIEVALRAWPWKSPPSQFRKFSCRDGARFEDVVFEIPDENPDLEGTIVDANGDPVPFAYLDLRPLDPGGIGQQERADASGRWHVYMMPEGRYEVVASVAGRGYVKSTVISPSKDIRLELGGVGRLEGTTPNITDGAFELRFETCENARIAGESRIVPVHGGRFSIDDVPACPLALIAEWANQRAQIEVVVAANDTAHVELSIGPKRVKRLVGTVRATDGRPVAHARVSVTDDDASNVVVTQSDEVGRYAIDAYAGAPVKASSGAFIGYATAGTANVPMEQLDIVLQEDMRDVIDL